MKKTFFLLTYFFIFTNLFCFEWPISEVTENSFNSYFGQLRGDKISTSLVFNSPSEVKNSEDGRILMILTNFDDDDSDFFPSTLGNAILISHNDELISVYGNLDKNSITINEKTETFIEKGTILGKTGNSGWQTDQSNLEFQIIDTKNSSAINPKILMSRLENENKYILSDISLVNKNGENFSINTKKTFPSGLYRVYQKKNEILTPSKTSISFNGVIADVISYDTINQENGKIYVKGSKKKYISEDIYPQRNRFLLGEILLTPGKITLGVNATDSLGENKFLIYNISVY